MRYAPLSTKTTTLSRGLIMCEDKREGGWSETSIWILKPNASWSDRIIGAVVTHPCAKAKWHVYDRDNAKQSFKTRRKAVEHAVALTRSLPEYSEAVGRV